MADRRVVITGLGIINAIGIGKDEYFNALLDGTIGIDTITNYNPAKSESKIAGQAPEIKMSKIVPKSHRKAIKLMSTDIQLAVTAADLAFRDAKLNTRGTDVDSPSDIDPTRSGASIGAGLISCDLVELGAAAKNAAVDGEFCLKKWGGDAINTLTPLWLLKYLPNMLNSHITIIHDLQGPSNSITSAEVSGLLSIAEGVRHIAYGKADVMVAGGAESKVNPMNHMRQTLIHRLSTHYNDKPKEACRPFDSDADGSVIGEGSAIIILEELEHALKRGATIYGEITGTAASYDLTDDLVEPTENGDGIAIAIQKAIAKANLKPEQIDLLIPHGLAVAKHDQSEAKAINTVFGEHTKSLPIFATKSHIGNCGAGGSAIDLVTAVLAMNAGKIPAMQNCPNPKAEYGLNINQTTCEKEMNHVMTCCYTYGGQTAAMVVSRYNG